MKGQLFSSSSTHPQVKICGLTREEDVYSAIISGADAIGCIVGVPRSPRNVSLNRTKELFSKVPPFMSTVIVIVSSSAKEVFEIDKNIETSAVQIHGNYSLEMLEKLRGKISAKLIATLTIDVTLSPNKNLIESCVSEALKISKYCDLLLLDSGIGGVSGGLGVENNFKVCKIIRESLSQKGNFIVLAGGLTPQNVEQAVREVRPYAVDVSSGVETAPGIKDEVLIKQFVKNAKLNSVKE
ncbi:hypothetical protein AC477_04695 [miscellaneous Crenarchaeota group-1 archaeon SG8-32-1]|uniref:N-(5'-phosphoribosyl)anthranilate isomerase n=1 Tax=miscellaneous Crenarchaeota group-1 archaeon SG8-32-1 TaxID=1685124 RepID=A0A0M0BRA1_9ARCH|nr:MAG: hypothetical protein AC477_04695 [miscellaneous Crenarchaeota group-1 archaeon SG8-32-1]